LWVPGEAADSTSTSPETPRNGSSSRVHYMPALDGVRAVSMLAIMAYHGGLSWIPGGFFAVDVFFVLSGFLITSLLIGERLSRGRIRLRAFWARRARRLLPALLVMIVAVTLYARFIAAPGMYPHLRSDALSAMFYVANWHFILTGQNYFVANGPVSPLLHTWTLGIEEQFYLVWPLLVVAVMWRARRSGSGARSSLWALMALSLVGAAASATEMALIYQPGDVNRVYFGSDTHAQSLLIGAALAAAVALWRMRGQEFVTARSARFVIAFSGLAGIAVLAWMWSQLNVNDSAIFDGGFALASVCVAATVLCAVLVPRSLVARALSFAPLRYLGRISYGMYLWHFPLDIALTEARVGVGGYALFGIRSALTIAIATVSYYGLEKPIRSGTFLTRTRALVATPVAVAGTVVALVVATSVPAVAAPPHAKPLAIQAPAYDLGGHLTAKDRTEIARYAKQPVRVLVVGDSVALTLSYGLYDAESSYHLQIYNEGIIGCGVAVGRYVNLGGQVQQVGAPCSTDPEARICYGVRRSVSIPCVSWEAAWKEWLKALHPNLVVLIAGRWEVADRTNLAGTWTNILNPAYAAYVKKQLESAVRIGTSTGATMIIETAPCFDSGEQPDGSSWPEDSPERLAIYNKLVLQVGSEFPKSVTVQNLDAEACPGGQFESSLHGVPLREADGVHFDIPASLAKSQDIGGEYLAPSLLPLWESLGHFQEAQTDGRSVVPGPAFPMFYLAPQ
jgi:peptidoglycan/LPS O-acetylase OafA/YrhL